jgi:nucleotide-binding universal stress UspA family protein
MFERILCAVDGSEHSERAVAAAAELGRLAKGEVVVLHVHEYDTRGRLPAPSLESSSNAEEIVNRAVRALGEAGVHATGVVATGLYGSAAKTILNEAKERQSGAIVIGSRGLSDLGGLLVGSVAHKVLHLADIPVVAVR